MPKLTPKQRGFITEYMKDRNGTQAAIRAGYSPRTANEQAAQLLAKLSIREEVERRMQKVEEKALVTAEYVITSLKDVADTCRKKIPLVKVIDDKPVPVTDEKGEPVFENVDSNGANKSLELLGKHLTLFTEKHQVSGSVNLIEVIHNSRKNRGLAA